MTICGDKLYSIGSTYDEKWNATYTYNTLGISGNGYTEEGSFITDGTQKDITAPYCVAVNPGSGEIYVTDAKNYASSGSVLCYSKEGKLLWKATTGDIPACIAFCKK